MKQISKFLTRLRRTFGPRQGKAGSSLGLVMIIGAALVIWVMCIMPLMTTTGTAALKTQSSYDAYLTSRSSIEFAKSELEKIVETDPPYTFAVVKNDDDTFTAVPKMVSNSLNEEYKTIINYDVLDDENDVPRDNDAGNKVTAICAVTYDTSKGNYVLTITCYNNGEKGITYSLIFTPSGSLLIYPEAYKQNQALPLSDFVLVDGKLGSNNVWYSNIKGLSDFTKLNSFTEILLPWKDTSDPDYASSGEYPAVFKTTAEAAVPDGPIKTEIVEPPFTAADWVMPYPSPTNGVIQTNGYVWADVNKDTDVIKVYMFAEGVQNITDKCKVYCNSVELEKDGNGNYVIPAPTGIYRITVDFPGGAVNNVNVLAKKGMFMCDHTRESRTRTTATCTVKAVNAGNGTFDAEFTQISHAMYGYCEAGAQPDDSGKYNITWSRSNVIEDLDVSKTYFFYYCVKGGFNDDKIFYSSSDVAYVGMLYSFKAVSSLEANVPYMVMSNNGYAMKNNGVDKTPVVENMNAVGSVNNGMLSTIPSGSAQWTVNNGSQIMQSGNYLKLDASNSWFNWRYSVSVTDEESDVSISFNNTAATVSKEIRDGWSRTTGYLKVSDSGTSATGSSSNVYFVKVPTAVAPAASLIVNPYVIPDFDMEIKNNTINSDIFSNVRGAVRDAHEIELVEVYANGQKMKDGDKLPYCGKYAIVGVYNAGTESASDLRYIKVGSLEIIKEELGTSDMAVTTQIDEADDLTITVTGNGWHNETYGGIRYIGYKEADAEEGTDFNWFPATDGGYTFRLNYGKYIFAMAESGTNTYVGTHKESEAIELKAKYVDLNNVSRDAFEFTYNSETGEVIWYDLPDNITPSKITLVFGKYLGPVGDDTVTWFENYDSSVTVYGAIIKGTDFDSIANPYFLGRPTKITYRNGRTSSMLRASSMYFMGYLNNTINNTVDEVSINTYGNDIYLTTDLIVLNGPITNGSYEEKGHVYVEPYSRGEGTPGNVLLFASQEIKQNGETIFKYREYYRIPANTDIYGISAERAESYRIKDSNGDKDEETIRYIFRQKIYPEMNPDVAYASNEQISRVISGETFGWCNNGIISGSDKTDDQNLVKNNSKYAVCAYITGMDGTVNRLANRVLIAAKTDGHYTLNVPNNMTFTTRYLSVDADQIVQGNSGVEFRIYNLGQHETFTSWLSKAIGFTNYQSKSLQMDYERYTRIITTDGNNKSIKKQICRYDHGDNLFGDAEVLPLMATYDTKEIEKLAFSGLGSLLSSTVKTVDRYVTLTSDDGTLNLGALGQVTLKMYANYIYVDPSVKNIKLVAFVTSDLKISSQESGYTTEEYMGWFSSNSAESYSGTLIYFPNDVSISYGGLFNQKHKTIEKGFYYIAANNDGTSLSTLADIDPIDPETLRNYSVYIDPKTGALSNAYVDTGLFDNTNEGTGGFSGGNTQ